MKKNTKKLLSLALALVMLLGAVPFASAAATLTVLPGTTVWEGQDVDVQLNGETSNEVWSTGHTNVNVISDKPTETTTYTVTYDEGTETGLTDSVTVTVKEKATAESLKLVQTEAYVGEEITLTATGMGSSTVKFSGENVEGNKFRADAEGTYDVFVIAENDPADSEDHIEVKAQIVVKEVTYTVEAADMTISLADKNTYVDVVAKKGAEEITPKGIKYAVTSGASYLSVNTETGLLTPRAAGTAQVTVTVTFDDNSTKSDVATIKVTDSGIILMKQDGEVFDDNDTTIDLDFSVSGPDYNEDVEWDFEVSTLGVSNTDDKKSPSFVWKEAKSSSSDKRKYSTEEEGTEIKDVELTVKKTGAIAMIKAYANWTGDSGSDAQGIFYIAVSGDDKDIIVTLKDSVDEFDWDENDVFSSIKVNNKAYTATQLKSTSLQDLLVLDADCYIDLDEGREYRDNEDVGEITTNSSRVNDYENDKTNTYEMDDLEYLTFEADDEGVYELEFVQYEKVNGYSTEFVLGEGTLQIVVGDAQATSKKGDINYNVKNKGEVTLDEDDFEEFFEDYCDDEDITGKDADFGYVMFEDYKASAINGGLYIDDDKNMKDTYLLHFDYDKDDDKGSKNFDLNEVVYKASSTKINYVDEIDFVCYSDDGEEICDGTVTFTVGEGEKETEEIGTMNFTDVKTSDWFYDAVKYVYEQGIMAGTSTTKFSPNTNLTRGMVVTMLYRVEGEPTVTETNKFSDVKSGDYYYNAVRWAAKNGIVNGVTDKTFAPNTNITRQDLATILYRYVKEYKGQSANLGTLTGFADASQVSDYASSAMKWAVGQGIINGSNGSLLPKGNATRAQAAAMLQRLLAK